MADIPATRCSCGCGAPSSTTRLRKASCPWCGAIGRFSRQVIVDALPVCGRCGVLYVPACLYDRVAHAKPRTVRQLLAQIIVRFASRVAGS